MRFLLDVNLSPKLLWEFRRLGHDCDHVAQAIQQNAKDREIAEFATRHAVILVTKDADFVGFSRAGLLNSQLVWLRCGNMSAKETCTLLRVRLPTAVSLLKAGRRIVEIND